MPRENTHRSDRRDVQIRINERESEGTEIVQQIWTDSQSSGGVTKAWSKRRMQKRLKRTTKVERERGDDRRKTKRREATWARGRERERRGERLWIFTDLGFSKHKKSINIKF